MIKWWRNWFTNNQRFTKENSDYRRIVMINATLSLMIIVLFGFGIFNIVIKNYPTAISELITASIAVGILIYFKTTHAIKITSLLGIFLLLIALTLVILFDPHQIYIYMWTLTVPAVTFFVLGQVGGAIVSIIYSIFITLLIIFYAPVRSNVPFDIIDFINLIGPYIATTIIIGYFELSRTTSLNELKSINRDLHILSITDKLTSLSNRYKLDETLSQEISKAEKSLKPLSVIMTDVDDFKLINDTYGHLMGDSILAQTAYLLSKEVGPNKTIGRWGGEEFLIICPHTDIEAAGKLARRLGNLIENVIFDGKANITISLGTSAYVPGDTSETIIRRADRALYEAKKRGKNRTHESD